MKTLFENRQFNLKFVDAKGVVEVKTIIDDKRLTFIPDNDILKLAEIINNRRFDHVENVCDHIQEFAIKQMGVGNTLARGIIPQKG